MRETYKRLYCTDIPNQACLCFIPSSDTTLTITSKQSRDLCKHHIEKHAFLHCQKKVVPIVQDGSTCCRPQMCGTSGFVEK